MTRTTSRRPASVTGAIWLLVAVVVMTGVTALLTLVFEDDLIDAWAAGRSDAGSVEPPAFVPVAITMFVVVASLAAVLIMFFIQGHNWARVLLTALVALMGVATVAGLRTGPAAFFYVLAAASLVVDVVAIAFLWHRDTRAWTGDRVETGSPT
jgi:hypothetical protein